jgi:WD40 repeat protein
MRNSSERSSATKLLELMDLEFTKIQSTNRVKKRQSEKSVKIFDTNKDICEIVQTKNISNSKLYFVKNKKFYAGFSTELISSTDDNEIKLWDVQNEVCIASLDAHKHYIWCLEYFEKTGEIISGSSDNKIKV